jgi:hypothetical protein
MTFTDTTPTQTPTPTPIQNASAGLGLRIAGVLALALAGLVLLGAGSLLAVHNGGRDRDGYYHGPAVAVASSGYAVSSGGLDIGALSGTEAFVVRRLLDRVHVSARTTTGKPIFVGLARRGDLDAYLSGASRTVVSDVRDDHTAVARELPGGALRGAPGTQGFWLAKASGSRELTIDWNVKEGHWALAVLNADGSPRTAADVRVAVKSDVLLWLSLPLFGLGLAAAFAGMAMLVASRRSSRQAPGSGSAPDDPSRSDQEA